MMSGRRRGRQTREVGPARREAPAKEEEEEDKERPLNAVARLKVIHIEAAAMEVKWWKDKGHTQFRWENGRWVR